jgi:hypothetical protein
MRDRGSLGAMAPSKAAIYGQRAGPGEDQTNQRGTQHQVEFVAVTDARPKRQFKKKG